MDYTERLNLILWLINFYSLCELDTWKHRTSGFKKYIAMFLADNFDFPPDIQFIHTEDSHFAFLMCVYGG
jgi:hypothetical protein